MSNHVKIADAQMAPLVTRGQLILTTAAIGVMVIKDERYNEDDERNGFNGLTLTFPASA